MKLPLVPPYIARIFPILSMREINEMCSKILKSVYKLFWVPEQSFFLERLMVKRCDMSSKNIHTCSVQLKLEELKDYLCADYFHLHVNNPRWRGCEVACNHSLILTTFQRALDLQFLIYTSISKWKSLSNWNAKGSRRG